MFSPSFSLRATPDKEVRFIISVSKKVAPRAVERNTIKRRIRPVLAALKPHVKPGRYLLIAKAGAGRLKGAKLKEEIGRLFGN